MPRTPPESHGLQWLEGLALLLPEVASYQSKIDIRPVYFDLFFKSFISSRSLSRPSVFRMINSIILNDRCATDAISRIVFPCWCSLITNCSLSHLFNTACNVCFVCDIIDSFFCLLLVVIICYFAPSCPRGVTQMRMALGTLLSIIIIIVVVIVIIALIKFVFQLFFMISGGTDRYGEYSIC